MSKSKTNPVPLWPGLRAMISQLGLLRALRVGAAMQRRTRAGQPFGHLPAPDCEEERLSREQIGPAILLYRQLVPLLGDEGALNATQEVAVAGAVAFLKQTVGPLRRAELAAMDQAGREAFVRRRGARFFNATIRWDRVLPEEVHFTVLSCRFPRLCAEAGVPQLAPIFCAGDAVFFGQVEPDVQLQRNGTIAEGAECCQFLLRLGDGS